MQAINPEIRDLQQKYEDLRAELARTQGEVEQIKHIASDTSRQTIWQFVIFTVTMAALLLGGLKYQADVLRREIDLRFEAQRQDATTRFEAIQQQNKQMEQNILARFEDLKQEVRASRKQQ